MPKDPAEDLSNVPKSVLDANAAAEAKIKEAADGPAPDPADQPAPIVNTDPPATQIKAEPAQTTNPTPVRPAIDDGTNIDDGYEHKYKVLKGKYDSEIHGLRNQITELQSMVERQNKVIENQSSQQSASKAEPSKIELDDLNPEDFDGWGDEMKVAIKQINSLKQVVSEQAKRLEGYEGYSQAPVNDGLKDRVESLESEINDTRIATYLKYLDSNIQGDWRKINKTESFNAWLNEPDPISLQPRRSSLAAAADALRGAQVASIFNLYIQAGNAGKDINIAEDLPNIGGNDGLESNRQRATVTKDHVKKAEGDFVQGRITEEEFDKIINQFQSSLG